MSVLRFLAVVFLVAGVSCLALAAIEHSESVTDRQTVQNTEEATGRLTDPGEPVFAEKFLLWWAFRFGAGLFACLSVLLVVKLRREKKDQKIQSIEGKVICVRPWWMTERLR